jgi:CheY-like chemotaxis protein
MQSDKKILIVEDDDDNVMAIKIILRNICVIDTIDSGMGAIEMSKANKYNLILMDIGLKGMNGLEAAQEIKKIPGYEKTPIVAVTAYAMVGDKEKFLQEGCTHYISKPFKAKDFREMVISLL